jgi:phosphoglucan,water dikinase
MHVSDPIQTTATPLPSAPQAEAEAAFTAALIETTHTCKSWRERLQWLRDHFIDPAFAPPPGQLAMIAIYLRFLATGELRCEEDGRHFRPNHHAEAALQIEAALERLTSPETAWILRRIYPYLPSWGAEFRRSEPLTRIRDIAHRNDIPQELKQEIKQRLQNKLHRCAGPEDLHTAEEIRRRVSSGGFAPDFVREFQIFHAELQEFFNATALEGRLQALAHKGELAESIRSFLALKAQPEHTDEQRLELLDRLTELRFLLADPKTTTVPQERSQRRLADIGLEDYAFTLLSECINRLGDLLQAWAWAGLLRALAAALENLRLSQVEPEECAALHAEVKAWARDFSATEDFHLRRIVATLARARRLAETYSERIGRLFPPRVQELGQALGIADHAIKMFSEGDIRAHVIFQLSKLVDLGLVSARQALRLPPWEAIVPGVATGRLLWASDLAEVEAEEGPLLLLLEQVDGDAEIPAAVQGIALGHPLPHLSHLGVRARQAGVPFAACCDRERLHDFDRLVGNQVQLRISADGITMQEADRPGSSDAPLQHSRPEICLPEVRLDVAATVLPLAQAEVVTCGAKSAGARRLLELAAQSNGLFQAPRGLAIPFAVLQRCLEAAPAHRTEYQALQDRLVHAGRPEQEILWQRLRELLAALPVPEEIGKNIVNLFGAEARLAVRSSANGEDLEYLAGAGLYESMLNVHPAMAAPAIAQVWASLWTRRAALSRVQAGIAHTQIRMAVLVQELIEPQFSFILHTVNPLTGNRAEAVAELAVGLGDILASAAAPGTPYRLTCDRPTGAAHLTACASFSIALRPSSDGVRAERLDYSRVPLSSDPSAALQLGKRLAAIASMLEENLGRPQDVEGVCVGDEVFLVQARAQQGL